MNKVVLFILSLSAALAADTGIWYSQIFPLQELHVHGSTLVECANGDIIVAWFQGSGERQAEDVRIMGARLKNGSQEWSTPFELADTPGLPDINPVLFIDPQGKLWLFYYAVIAHQWETSLLKYKIANEYEADGPPKWDWQEVLHIIPVPGSGRGIQPGDPFLASVKEQLEAQEDFLEKQGAFQTEELSKKWQDRKEELIGHAAGENMVRSGRLYHEDGSYDEQSMGYPWFRRMGWQTRNKPFVVGERMILPLYSDGFSFSLMAITDDWGKNWHTSAPIVGLGNIQPAIAETRDGDLVTYMRDNGPPPKRLHVSRSTDKGETWGLVQDTEIPNPGAGADVVTLDNGDWVLLDNDVEEGRHSLAVYLSTDEGKTWPYKRHIELDERGKDGNRYHYPAVIQGKDGMLHVCYSYFKRGENRKRNSIRYARFSRDWIMADE